jgi:hypothetical protein
MAKLVCAACGHVIVDQSDYLPHKAELVKDQDAFDVWMGIADDCADYLRVLRSGSASDRRAWIAQRLPHLTGVDASDDQVIVALVLDRRRRYSVEAFECTQCGRLWVERSVRANSFAAFAADSGTYERVLASEFGGAERERR